eukprot:6202416-Pleurochrysis_carterae.AAC.1
MAQMTSVVAFPVRPDLPQQQTWQQMLLIRQVCLFVCAQPAEGNFITTATEVQPGLETAESLYHCGSLSCKPTNMFTGYFKQKLQ